jgi:hypothetical protein
MIRELILSIHHVYQIDQVLVVITFFLVLLILSLFIKGNGTALQYGGTNNSLKSSLTILPNSLKSNETYQFMVFLTSRQNSTLQVTGYLLVQVEDTQTQLIVIA